MTVTNAATALPAGLTCYKRTESFDQGSVPASLRNAHATKAGVWGLIRVTEGVLRYRIEDERRLAEERLLTAGSDVGVIEPTILHRVEPAGAVRFHVEFWRPT